MSRSMLIVFFALAALAVSGCSSRVIRDRDLAEAVASLAERDWRQVTIADIRRMWPRGRTSEGRTDQPPAGCHGTTTLTYRRAEDSHGCRHCETFVFDHEMRGDACHDVLTTVSIYYATSDQRNARDVALKLLRAVAVVRTIPAISTHKNGVDVVVLPERSTDEGVERVTATIAKHHNTWLVNMAMTRVRAAIDGDVLR